MHTIGHNAMCRSRVGNMPDMANERRESLANKAAQLASSSSEQQVVDGKAQANTSCDDGWLSRLAPRPETEPRVISTATNSVTVLTLADPKTVPRVLGQRTTTMPYIIGGRSVSCVFPSSFRKECHVFCCC